LTGLPCRAARRHLDHLLGLGFVKRLGRAGSLRWTLTERLVPPAVFDAAAEPAWREAHGVPSKGPAGVTEPPAQRALPFETAALAARLAGAAGDEGTAPPPVRERPRVA
jgi:hypothetical protein